LRIDDIKFLKNIPEGDLAVIYNMADFFVYPSFFEGFGMPVLEAMSCGCPVICSNASSLPEVVGDAGLTFNPNDGDGLESAMKDMAGNAVLRQDLRNKGLERAKMFSWEKCARETLEVYKTVV
jgi:glycosyltransferase involved in cell wall biosynthesis